VLVSGELNFYHASQYTNRWLSEWVTEWMSWREVLNVRMSRRVASDEWLDEWLSEFEGSELYSSHFHSCILIQSWRKQIIGREFGNLNNLLQMRQHTPVQIYFVTVQYETTGSILVELSVAVWLLLQHCDHVSNVVNIHLLKPSNWFYNFFYHLQATLNLLLPSLSLLFPITCQKEILCVVRRKHFVNAWSHMLLWQAVVTWLRVWSSLNVTSTKEKECLLHILWFEMYFNLINTLSFLFLWGIKLQTPGTCRSLFSSFIRFSYTVKTDILP
jgi:hypothetical protein